MPIYVHIGGMVTPPLSNLTICHLFKILGNRLHSYLPRVVTCAGLYKRVEIFVPLTGLEGVESQCTKAKAAEYAVGRK